VLKLPDITSRFPQSMYLQVCIYDNLCMKFHISSFYCTAAFSIQLEVKCVLHPATILIPYILQNTGPQKEGCMFIYRVMVRV